MSLGSSLAAATAPPSCVARGLGRLRRDVGRHGTVNLASIDGSADYTEDRNAERGPNSVLVSDIAEAARAFSGGGRPEHQSGDRGEHRGQTERLRPFGRLRHDLLRIDDR